MSNEKSYPIVINHLSEFIIVDVLSSLQKHPDYKETDLSTIDIRTLNKIIDLIKKRLQNYEPILDADFQEYLFRRIYEAFLDKYML